MLLKRLGYLPYVIVLAVIGSLILSTTMNKWNLVTLRSAEKKSDQLQQSKKVTQPKKITQDIIPNNVTSYTCDMLFGAASRAHSFELSPAFDQNVTEFEAVAERGMAAALGYSVKTSGSSRNRLTQTLALHYLASNPEVKTVCETGFLYGFSAFNYLTANDQLVVHSFTLEDNDYFQGMVRYLSGQYQGRLHVYFGDSVKEIPKFIERNPSFRCDLIFIDGDHTYQSVANDIRNFASIARYPGNESHPDDALVTAIVIDDYVGGVAQAWDEALNLGIVQQTMSCAYNDNANFARAFAAGIVSQRPVRK